MLLTVEWPSCARPTCGSGGLSGAAALTDTRPTERLTRAHLSHCITELDKSAAVCSCACNIIPDHHSVQQLCVVAANDALLLLLVLLLLLLVKQHFLTLYTWTHTHTASPPQFLAQVKISS